MGLRQVNLAKVEANAVGGLRILWGRVEHTEDGLTIMSIHEAVQQPHTCKAT